jgi:hypothetical protein
MRTIPYTEYYAGLWDRFPAMTTVSSGRAHSIFRSAGPSLQWKISRSVRGLAHSCANYTAEIRYWKLDSFVIGLFYRCRTLTQFIVQFPLPMQSGKPSVFLETLFPYLHIISITEEDLLFLKSSKPVLVCFYINVRATACAKTGIFSITCTPLTLGIQHEFYVEIPHNIHSSFICLKAFDVKWVINV